MGMELSRVPMQQDKKIKLIIGDLFASCVQSGFIHYQIQKLTFHIKFITLKKNFKNLGQS